MYTIKLEGACAHWIRMRLPEEMEYAYCFYLFFTYDHNTSIMMRLKLNYLNIAMHIMICLILNYLIIAPQKLQCSTSWIVQHMNKNWNIQAHVTSWTFRNKMNNRLFTLILKLNIELVLFLLTQIDYHRGAAHEAEVSHKTSIKETRRRIKD